MASEHHLLFGILAYQNGFLSRAQLLTAVDLWLQDKTQGIDQILLRNEAISADELRLFREMMGQLLSKLGEQESFTRTIGSDTDALLAELRSRDDEDIFKTIGPATSTPVSSHTPPSEEGRKDGPRFNILRPHAEGGLGKISVALDTDLDREVALKEIKPRFADDAASRARFLLEAEITGGLEHPGIVPIYALGTSAGGRPYYAMRFIKGDNLAIAIKHFHEDTVEADRAVALRRLLGRFLDICNAVYYAHQRGVLHRDLKPGNVMLGEYGETLVVDWGLAKPMEQPESQGESDGKTARREMALHPLSSSAVDATQLGSAIGSPHYMSPEQARGEIDRLGVASDVYSLGATLYALLTNHKPVEGESLQEILEKVQFGNRLTARQQNPNTDAALSAICERAMALEATERYSSARKLADDIEHYLADEPVQAYREPLLRRSRRWVRKHPRAVGSLAATLVAGVIGAAMIAGVVSSSNQKLSAKNIELAKLNVNLEKARNEAVEARDEALKARDQAETVAEFTTQVFRSPDPRWGGRDLRVVQLLGWAVKDLDDRFQDDPVTKAALLDAIGKTYLGLGMTQKAVSLCERAFQLRQQNLGQNDPILLSSMNNLAQSYHASGQFKKALEIFEETLQLRRKVLGAEHLDTLTTMNDLGVSYRDAGKTEKAIALLDETLKLRQEKLGSDHPVTLISMSNLALSYRRAGRIKEAIQLNEEVLRLRKAALRSGHPHILSSMNNLALSYRDAGRTSEALQLLNENYKTVQEKLGPDHPYTLAAMNNVAQTCRAAGQNKKALKLLEEVLSRRRAKLGVAHPDTLTSMNDLALSYLKDGQINKALTLSEKTLEKMREQLGVDHPATLQSMNSLALSYRAARQFEKAIALHEETLKLRRQVLRADHPDIYTSMNNLALSLSGAGQIEEALLLFEETLDLVRMKLGPDHPITLKSMNNLAQAYRGDGQIKKALALFEETLSLRSEKLGEDHPDTLASMFDLARTHELAGRQHEAHTLYETTLRTAQESIGEGRKPTIMARHRLAWSHAVQGDLEQAIALYETNFRSCQKTLGERHKSTWDAWVNYRNVLLLTGNNDQLINLCEARMPVAKELGNWRLIASNHATIAEALLARQQWDAAIHEARQALKAETGAAPEKVGNWWAESILGSAYAGQQKWQEADEHLQQAVSRLPTDRTNFRPFDWHLSHRIFQDLAQVHANWEDSTEREKWQAELANFEADRNKLDPFRLGERQKW